MSHLSNFLNETEHHIRMLDKTPDSIIYIGTNDGELSCTWKEFETLADKEYHRGGSDETMVSKDLIIVFTDHTVMYRSVDDNYLECWDTISVIGKRIQSKPMNKKSLIWC